jgi:hypothetical protein
VEEEMKIRIEFDCDNAAFEFDFAGEVNAILRKAYRNIMDQSRRPKALCTHPEAADVLLDTNGNTVGTVVLEGVKK